MKVIFLDIDGVLVNAASLAERSGRRAVADHKCVYALNWLTGLSGSSLVLSSSWRFCGLEEMRLILRHWGVAAELVGMTPDLTRKRDSGIYEATPRGREIQLWMDQNERPDRFVILDDECDMEHLNPWLIRTEFGAGLTESDAREALRVLSRTDVA